MFCICAWVSELVYELASNPSDRKVVGVRVPPQAPSVGKWHLLV